MRISDWSSDVCSSDLLARVATFLSDPQRSFPATLRRMMTTNHLGAKDAPQVHPVVASAAREVLNKSENERRSEEHTSELQSLMRISYAVFCLKKKTKHKETKKRTKRKHNTKTKTAKKNT